MQGSQEQSSVQLLGCHLLAGSSHGIGQAEDVELA